MRRFPALALTLAAGLATLTACGSDTDDAVTAISSAPTVSTVTVTAPASSTSEPAPEVTDEIEATEQETEQETEAADTGSVGSDACAAATDAALHAAVRASAKFSGAENQGAYRRIQCSAPFAIATTVGNPQSSGILFRRDGARWVVLDVGSAMQCAQYGVTAAQVPALEGCGV